MAIKPQKPTGGYPGFTIPLEEFPELAAELGIIVALFSALEDQMCRAYCWAKELYPQVGAEEFYDLSGRRRREALKECLTARLSERDAADWHRFIDRDIANAAKRRNEAAHHLFGVGEFGKVYRLNPLLKPGRKGAVQITLKGTAKLRYDLGALNRKMQDRFDKLRYGATSAELDAMITPDLPPGRYRVEGDRLVRLPDQV